MLKYLGKTVTSKPWFVVIIIVLITLGFSTFLPSLEMKTSMEDFLPDDDVVLADERIQDYFGATNEVVMVLVSGDTKQTLISADGLENLFQVSEDITMIDQVDDVMSIAGFVDLVCSLEYNKSLNECTSDEITSAYYDLMSTPSMSPLLMNRSNDPNEAIDYQRFSRVSRKVSQDSLDVKNLEIQQNDTHLTFSILLYDTSTIESLLLSKGLNTNIIEWFISFQNIIGPSQLQEVKYRLSARLEPKEELWSVGQGMGSNLVHMLQLIRTRDLRNSYTFTPILWMTPPGEDMAFPIPLSSGNISWNEEKTGISIRVNKKELGEFGLGFEDTSFGMPARIGNLYAGTRCYQRSLLQMPWKRVTVDLNATENLLGFVQNRPLLGNIGQRLLEKKAGMSWDDINEMFAIFKQQISSMDALSLKQMDQLYKVTDRAPDTGYMPETVFLKPSFLEDIRETVINFIDSSYTIDEGARSVLLMVNINGSVPLSELESISKKIVRILDDADSEYADISFEATGNSIVEYEINEVSMEANSLIMPLMFIVIIIVLFVSFRKLSYVVLPLLGLSFAIVWMFGSMVLLQMPFMVMEVALIPMLMGLGVDYSVHLYHNYRVEKGKGKNAKDAMETSIQDIGIAMLLATITTFIAFLSFLTATMMPLRDFGVLCAVGIAYVFAITLTFQASMRFILDKRKERMNKKDKVKEKKQSYGIVMRKIARMVCNHPVPILVLTIVITAVMAFGATQIETGFAMEDFLPEENPSVAVMNTILNEYPFASQEKEYILIEHDNIATVSVLKDMDEVIDRSGNNEFVLFDRDGSPKTESILSVMRTVVEENVSLVEEFSLDAQGIPQSDRMVEDFFNYLYDHESYGFETQSYIHKNDQGRYNATVMHMYTDINGDNGDNGNVMEAMYTELTADTKGLFSDASITVTGENSMMYVIMNSMTESQLLSTVFCLVLAAIVLIIAYRNPVLGLITMIPVIFSTVWIVGAMYYIGYTLNVMTIMITSLTIGLGITYAIHAVERFRLVANNTGDVMGAVAETIGHTGGALLISAITTILGFGMLVFTPMPVEQQFGLITALTIAFAFLTSIFILPPVLLFWGRWRKNHKGYIISKGDPNKK